jgi:LysM repeat protein
MKIATKLLSLATTVLLLALPARAQQEATPASSPEKSAAGSAASGSDLRALQQAIESQTKQLEALRQAIHQLTERFPAKEGTPAGPAAATTPPKSSSENTAASTPPTSPATETPKAEPATAAATGPQHTVAKGETLTSISKHYKIPIADLQTANKITDDRKLQIGQVLNLPTPKPSEPAKKENP